MHSSDIVEALYNSQDETYRQMQIRILPNLPSQKIIGVRTPTLRKIAKDLEDPDLFIHQLPHYYFEENQIHIFLLANIKAFDTLINEIERFLPYIDNWATCDQLRPRYLRRFKEQLLPYILQWIDTSEPYTIRFAVECLMLYYLDDPHYQQYLETVANVHSEDYYVKMMIAWFFATALTKHYRETLPYISSFRLDKWIHNKTIQKAIESRCIAQEQKDELKQFRLK